jgi:hypothetical protein
LETIAAAAGEPRELGEEISAVRSWNPHLRPLSHPNPDAYTLLDVPRHLAASFSCANRAAGRYHQPLIGQPDFDEYRALVFRLRSAGQDSPALFTLWRETDGWKIESFYVLTH